MDNIFVLTLGGLGDQVCAEPVIREIRRMYPDKRVGVVGQRAFFAHLDVEVFGYESEVRTDGDTLLLKTFAAEEWGVTLFLHPVDFISISTIHRTLPAADKQMRLRSDPDLVEKFSIRNKLLIHAGKSWENKTFPREWWQEVVDLCSKSRECVLIGNDQGDKGVLDITCPPGCVDLRGRTTIEELVALISANDVLSNDSFPAHVAGAFDNWIFMIPTIKHPEFLLPFRKGRQDYRSCCPLRRLMYDDVVFPIRGPVAADKVPDGRSIMDYLPRPREVEEAVSHRWKRPLDGSILWFG